MNTTTRSRKTEAVLLFLTGAPHAGQALALLLTCPPHSLHFFKAMALSGTVPDLGTLYLVPTIGTMIKTLHSSEYKRLTSWLKKQREAQGLSMRDLAAMMGVPHSFVGKVEQQGRRLDVIEYLQYCEALGVSPLNGLKAISKKLK